MILKTDNLKELSQTILPAVESTDISSLPETLELIASNGILNFNVTNKEYFLNVKLPVDPNEEFHATINAILFLRLISQLTTETVELTIDNSSLVIKANGVYHIALIFEEDKLFHLPVITIEVVDEIFHINGDSLFSILKYNTKQISTGILSRPVQKMYYVDENGAITFTSGACVNKFINPLNKPIKLLFNQRLVKLFKLFKDLNVVFKVGHSDLDNGFKQSKVQFESSNIVLTAILPSDSDMLNSVPVSAIRSRAETNYPCNVYVDTSTFSDAINRMKLFVAINKAIIPYLKLVFTSDCVLIQDLDGKNVEKVTYSKDQSFEMDEYYLVVDLNELQSVLDTCSESILKFSFGDSQAMVISRLNIKNIIPEVRIDD